MAEIQAALEYLGALTYREQARKILETAKHRNSAPAMARLGWLAGGQSGDVPTYALLALEYHTKSKSVGGYLLDAYATGYHYAQETTLLVEQATPVKISEAAIDEYKRDLRRPVRAFWDGSITRDAFISTMTAVTERGLTRAWREGIARFGLTPDELTAQEVVKLQLKIAQGLPAIDKLATRIESNSKANGGNLTSLYTRVDGAWLNRFNDLKQAGEVLAGADRKAMWVLGVAEHCISCLKLAGKVKRYSFWQSKGILPRQAGAEYLVCKGYECKCSLKPTRQPLTRGPLPALP